MGKHQSQSRGRKEMRREHGPELLLWFPEAETGEAG